MATGEKPYRVYRGGRTKGRVPLDRPQSRQTRNGRAPAPPKIRRPRRRWSWPKRIGVALLVLVLVTLAWAVAGFFSFRNGVEKANKRLEPSVQPVLTKQDGLLLSNPTSILLLGRDHENTDARVGLNNSDSIMVLRTDPSRHRLVYLSIPRDLRVPIPGYGDDKINSAMPRGGTTLAIRTIENFTGLPINHVMIVDFASFKNLIDNIGGIDVYVKEHIISNPFDCPYPADRCRTWKGWNFGKGWHHMDGRVALVYSRIRHNQLNAADTDISRGERQQQVLRATLQKLLGVRHVHEAPVQRQEAARAAHDRSLRLAVRATRVEHQARRRQQRAPLSPRRNGDVDRRRVGDRRDGGEPLRDPDGEGRLGTAAAAAGVRALRAGLRGRKRRVPLKALAERRSDGTAAFRRSL